MRIRSRTGSSSWMMGVIVEQVPLGRLLDHPVDERTQRFLRRVAQEEDIAA
jgi:hypothetical protein